MGGITDLVKPPEVVTAINHLGYPLYFLTLLGIAKLLGVCALLSPKLPILKEWAYAGFAINFIAAIVSHASVGDPATNFIAPAIFLAVGAASYTTRPASRTRA